MREAIIICPKLGNKGEDISQAHDTLREALLKHFGGFRYRDACGVWRSPDTGVLYEEECREYVVACVDSLANVRILETIARQFRIQAKQECVYLRWPDGSVWFV